MNNKNNVENGYSLLNLVIIFILMYIPFFLLSKKLYILVSIYVVLISICLIWINWKTIINNIKTFSEEHKKLKKLEYYHITDDNKIIDLEKRRNTFSLFRDMTMGTFLISIINFMAIHTLFQQLFGESAILDLATMIIIALVVCIGYGGMIASIVYKYTTTIYISIPLISALVYFSFLDSLILFLPDFVRFAGYLLTTVALYFILAYAFPAHTLRKLNSKTVLISSFTTILATFFSQIFQYFFLGYVQARDFLLTIESVQNVDSISDTLKNIILDNPDLIDVINHFLMKETSGVLTSITSLVITALTISYIVGGLIINKKIRKNKMKAKNIYRTLIKEKNIITYHNLIECAFYGGEEYENLLLNNDITLEVIRENEVELVIPDVSRKTRFIGWWKRNSMVYNTFNDIKQIFKF